MNVLKRLKFPSAFFVNAFKRSEQYSIGYDLQRIRREWNKKIKLGSEFWVLEKAERKQQQNSCPQFKSTYKKFIIQNNGWLSCVQTIWIECGIPCAYRFIENVKEAHFKEYAKNKLQDVDHSGSQWITSMKNNTLQSVCCI